MIKRVELICPYCKNEFSIWLDLEQAIKRNYVELVYCDVDDTPGCGKPFVIAPEVQIALDVYEFTRE